MSLLTRKSFRSQILTGFRSSDAVALTFDDGPDPDTTPKVLEILRRHGARATFFVIGRQAELYSDVLRQIIESGSEIGNHSYNHFSFSFLPSYSRFLELRHCEQAVGRRCSKYFRPPYGHARRLTPLLASGLNYMTVGWSAEARDWETSDASTIAKRLSDEVRPGSIVLLHDRLEDAKDPRAFDRTQMLDGLEMFLSGSAATHSFKTISEMLEAYEPVFGKSWDAELSDVELKSIRNDLSHLIKNTGQSLPSSKESKRSKAPGRSTSVAGQGVSSKPTVSSFRRPGKGLFVFAIPLIGSHLTDDFESICRLLGKTLKSCLQQTDKTIAILIACNEIPPADFVPQDDRIAYLVLDRVSRARLLTMPRLDVVEKRHALMKAAVNMQAKYYFQFDADDLVSNRLVESVRSINDANGYIIDRGYLLDSRSDQLYPIPNATFPNPKFDELCGSSVIVSFLDEAGAEAKSKNMDFVTKVWRLGHDLARSLFLAEGRPPQVLDFPAVIYRANHGRNLYMQLNPDERTLFIDGIVSKCSPLSGEQLNTVRGEFGLS